MRKEKAKKEGLSVTCPNPKCKHTWNYKGNSKFYVTCPQCYNKVKLPRFKT